MINAVIYCRVSSDRQVREGDGLGSQEQRCRQYAENNDYKILDVFREEGESGGLFERPAMKRLLKFLGENDLGKSEEKIVVIFDDLKRFARDTEVHFGLKREIYSRNGRVESPNFRFEDTPEGKFVETMMAAHAELERNQNKRQVIQKMKARLERGYWPFMPPLGLINKKDPVHGKILTPKEPHASIFKRTLEKYRDGILTTKDEVTQYLHQEYKNAGLPNRPSTSTTAQILKNPLYAGYIEYKDWGVSFRKAKHEGFISVTTFQTIQDRLKERSKPWRRRDYSKDFPLRPHVLCNGCGKPMTASWNSGRHTKYPNYFCRNKTCVYCWKVVNKFKLESQFEILLSNSKPLDGYVDLALDVLQEQWDIKLGQYVVSRNKIKDNLKDTKDNIQWYVERLPKVDETLATTYEGKIKDLRLLERNLELNLKKKLYTSDRFGTASEKVFNTLKKPVEMWKSDEYFDKRAILFMYFEKELRYDYNLGFGTAGLAYPIKLINEIGQAKTSSVEMSAIEAESEKVI